ncbi:MAG: NAD(P)H-dependent oxidoreductase [Lachnospiraceae bacterium]|nr:NAD(P)H-dependent oxidoreductase [Lachnospiraceae bacterium]
MKVLVLNGSPAGDNSITLQTINYIRKFYENMEFDVLHAGKRIKSFEKDFSVAAKALAETDLIIFCYPVYTFLVPAQLHRFIELIGENGIDISGKYATQVSTSKHFYDTTAHAFIRDICHDLGLKYVRGLSADMEDLLGRKGQKQARDFFRYVRWNMKHGYSEPYLSSAQNNLPAPMETEAANRITGFQTETDERDPSLHTEAAERDPGLQLKASLKNPASCDRRIAIVADLPAEGEASVLREMVTCFQANCAAACDVINIREFPFKGGCLGCFHCAADGTCIYKDGFDRFLRENIQEADAVVYAFAIRNHSMGSRFKMFDDRQFCNGHRTVTMGKPVGYLIEGDLTREINLQTVMEARAQVGGNFLAGIASSGAEMTNIGAGVVCSDSSMACIGAGMEGQVLQLARTMEYAISTGYNPPANFYGVGGMKIFRDLIFQMQGLMREDHRFYKEHHFYDFPQKRKGMIVGMYLVGAMMNNPKLKRKMGGKMTEGMLMPYRKVLESMDRRKKKK